MLRKCLHSALLATFCILKIHIESINEEPGGGGGGTHLESQHVGSRGRQVSLSRPA